MSRWKNWTALELTQQDDFLQKTLFLLSECKIDTMGRGSASLLLILLLSTAGFSLLCILIAHWTFAEFALMNHRIRHGFTLLELMVTLTVIAVLAVLVLPAINGGNGASRKMNCANNIRQIGLAMLEYEQAHRQLVGYNCTWGYGGYDGIPFWDVAPGYAAAGRWSGFIALLPYLEQSKLQTAIHEGTVGSTGAAQRSWGPYGSVASTQMSIRLGAPADSLRYPWSHAYQPNRTQVTTFRCPSAPGKLRPNSMWNVARTDYGFCLGDGQIGIHSGDLAEVTTRGAFQWNQNHPLAAITDGAANTVAFGEIATPDRASFTAENKGALEKDARVQGRAIYELAYETELKGIDVNKCRNLSAVVAIRDLSATGATWGCVTSMRWLPTLGSIRSTRRTVDLAPPPATLGAKAKASIPLAATISAVPM